MHSTSESIASNTPSRGISPLVEVIDVCRSFDEGTVHALSHISLSIGRGKYVAIMGPSASGKSTLLNLLGALDQPTSGEIRFDGWKLVRGSDLDRFRASTLGFVFQSFYFLPTLTSLE